MEMVTMSDKKPKEWQYRHYLIINEVSRMDCKVITRMHTRLSKAKSLPELKFRGVNIIFMGDTPSNPHSFAYIS